MNHPPARRPAAPLPVDVVRGLLPHVLLAGMLATGLVGAAAARQASDVEQQPLAAASLDAWRDHIRPSEAERAWERIGWQATFADGLRAANAARKPLLLWMMNGHPLGCT